MSKDVENRIVSLTFENQQFKAKAAETIKVIENMQKSLKGISATPGMADIKPALGALDTLKAKFLNFHKDSGNKPMVDMKPTIAAMEEFGARASSTAIPVTAGLRDVQAAAEEINLQPAGESASMASAKFIAFAAAAGAALYTIGAKAVQMAGQLASSFTLEPMKDGFREFETNMGSIQTILANTDRYGTTLPQVEQALDELNTYSDKTIYNFGQMVKNIGLFTNAGIRIEDATSMIQGFSNVAAASGTNAEQAAGAAYQLSQALSAGKVTLMDWKSLQNAGMGNKNMQEGLIKLAEAMGTLGPAGTNATEIQENFNGSLEKGWLKADVMSNYLKIMAGDLSAAEMATLGLSEEQIKWYQRQQGIAEDAATKVRTFTQLLSTVKESIGSGWSESFRNVIGGFEEGTALFTGINKAISGMVGNAAKARNDLLYGWKAFGGRSALIEGLIRSVGALRQVIDPVRLAFREIFPRQSVEGLLNLTKRFVDFTKTLTVSKGAVETIRNVFRGFFALVKMAGSILWEVGKLVLFVFKDAFGGAVSNGIMPFIGAIGNVLTAVSHFLTEGDRLKKFFAGLRNAIHHVLGPFKGLIQIFIAIGRAAGALFGGVMRIVIDTFRDLFGATDKAKGAGKATLSFFDMITRGTIYAVDYINKFTIKLRGFFDALHDFLGMMRDPIKAFQQLKAAFMRGFENPFESILAPGVIGQMVKLGALLGKIKDAFMGGFENPFAKVSAGGFDGLFIRIGQAVGKAKEKLKEFGESGQAIFDGIKKSIVDADWLGMLKDVGRKLKESFMSAIDAHSPSRMFIEAAKSIPQGIAEGIRSGWEWIKGVFSDLADKLSEWFGKVKDTLDEASDDVDWDQVISGGAVVAFLSFVNTLRKFRKDMSGLIDSMSGTFDELGGALQGLQKKLKAEALKELAIAISILVASILILTFVDPEKLKVALAAIALGFTELAGTMKLMDRMSSDTKGMLGIGAAFLGLGLAIVLLATAVKMLSNLGLGQLATGLGAIGLLMVGMVAAMRNMPDKSELGGISIAFVAVAGSMVLLAHAVKTMGEMSAMDLIQGVLAVGALSYVLVKAANEMTEALPGATALVAAAGSLLILAGAVKIIGELSFPDILQGVGAIALLATIMVLAANSMTKALPGASAMVAMAAGVYILAQALVALSDLSLGQIAAGLGAIAALIGILAIAVVAITATGGIAIPAMEALGTTLLMVGAGFALIGAGAYLAARALQIFAENGSKGMDTFMEMMKRLIGMLPELVGALVESIIDMVIQIADRFPEVMSALGDAFTAFLDKAQELMPLVFATLQMFFDGLIQLVIDTGPRLIQAAFVLITSFLTELISHAFEFGYAAALMMAQFINGIAMNVLPLVNSAIMLITSFLNALTMRLPELIQAGANLIVAYINGIASMYMLIVNAAVDMVVMILNGVAARIGDIVTAGANVIISFIRGIGDNMGDIVTEGTKAILKFIEGLATNAATFATATGEMILDFLTAIDNAVQSYTEDIAAKGRSIAWHLISGVAKGLISNDNIGRIKSAVKTLTDLIPDFLKEKLGVHSPSKVMYDIAKWIPAGMALGIEDHAHMPLASVTDLGERITSKFQDALSGVPDVLNGMEEFNPVIAPVLDLSQVTADARRINGLVDTINPSVSLGAAKLISSTEDVRGNATDDSSGGTVVNKTFVQNNYSPEALSANDIYRNTKSQFAMEKEDLQSA